MLVERDFLGGMHLKKRPLLFFPILPPPLPHPPGVQQGDSWSHVGSLVAARLVAHSPRGLGISLLLPPSSLAFPSCLPSSLPQQHGDWLARGASRQYPSLETEEHL